VDRIHEAIDNQNIYNWNITPQWTWRLRETQYVFLSIFNTNLQFENTDSTFVKSVWILVFSCYLWKSTIWEYRLYAHGEPKNSCIQLSISEKSTLWEHTWRLAINENLPFENTDSTHVESMQILVHSYLATYIGIYEKMKIYNLRIPTLRTWNVCEPLYIAT
jgi:hypothetical protein